MNHFRDRVILTSNAPQLPSGKRATVNVPGIVQQPQSAGAITAVIVALSSIDAPSVNMGSLVPTQTKNATTP